MLAGQSSTKKVLTSVLRQGLVVGYNFETAALYLSSAINFPSHMGSPHSLIDWDSDWRISVLSVICFFDAVLLVSNQLVFPKRLENLFGIS